ncbi:hypothetical protein [Paraburkholderia nemoris]|uniref:Uncharacterized protein n=1 Tax=Paraburkholderia nemoris TaxID=2793076 RepID=A0ABN7LIU1_9BURK|nr:MULTISPECIES: hypothetical protein [Paraburkholderia]MBK3812823.1 hypothetical protein [Paraburkholderia aspalathi]CAE6752961.1 hypothetical protein R69776_03013 [Paraburkholderia nemoris]CAE6830215.1 hypothetical protein R75777_06565 [Paraburkholderia nemoris]
MSDKKRYSGRARLAHNLSGYEYLLSEFNPAVAKEVTSFRTKMTPTEVDIGYRFALAMSNPAVDLMEDAEKIVATGSCNEGSSSQGKKAA